MESSKLEIPANYVTGILGASGGYDEGHLISAEDSRRFCGVATFLKAPLLKDMAEPTVGFVGILSTAAARAPAAPVRAARRARGELPRERL
jgi:hypothetical protein